ncbi:PIN-like domain-containing protein, partial [Lactococcus carnosus]|uniref:PIN-like domain-containing protein n=1 Tax=Pseudolactococcus carnosus TaxID=2749961 RepID=UPI001FBA2A8E
LNKSSQNIIILDTNYLLEIIKSPVKISDTYIKALEKVQDNIYIPYLVALEFNFNKSKSKKEKITNIRDYTHKIKKSIDNVKDNINKIDFLNGDAKKDFTNNLTDITNKYYTEITKQIEKNFQSILTDEQDILYERLINIIEHKIGKPYEQEWINEIEQQGEERYNNNIPPGFNDKDKSDSDNPTREYSGIRYQRKYGDLIIWKDILEFTKQNSKKGKKVIFVTNDGTSKNKNDLLYKINNLTVGPHIFLMNELQKESNKELHILNHFRFIQFATDLPNSELDILQETVDNQKKTTESFNKNHYIYRVNKSESEEALYNKRKENRLHRLRGVEKRNLHITLTDIRKDIEDIEDSISENKYRIFKIQKIKNDDNLKYDKETCQEIEFELKQLSAQRDKLNYRLMDMKESYYKLQKYLENIDDMEY